MGVLLQCIEDFARRVTRDRAGDLRPRTAQVLRQFLFDGVTTVLNVGATNGSVDEILELRRRRAAGELQGPHIYATPATLLRARGGASASCDLFSVEVR